MWIHSHLLFGQLLHERFFETPKLSIIGILVLLKYENELELVTSDTSFNSVSP